MKMSRSKDVLISVTKQIWRLRFWLVSYSLIVTIIAVLWAITRPMEYKCELEFVPPDFSTASPLLKNAALIPGTSSDLERISGYLQAFSLRQMLVDTFRLYDHYKVQASDPYKRLRIIQDKLEDKYQVRITRNSTILVQIRDESPDMAYQMILFVQRKVEDFSKSLIGMDQALKETERQINQLLAYITSLERELSEIRTKYRIITAGENHTGGAQIPTPEAFAYYDRVLSQETRLIKLQETYAHLLEEKTRREDFLRVYPNAIFIIQPPYKPMYPER
ncbi:MAG: hypothetical protein NZ580_02110, partial [Bacteroidia bacterium]|nr:hypothetical protein [Bacteroidia bacterium]